jgi:hypothetical protein
MNESASIPPHLPPHAFDLPPLGSAPEEREPIRGPLTAFEAILRQPRRVLFQLRQPRIAVLLASFTVISLLSALVYGAVVGTFSGHDQLWIAPLKITGGMLVSTLICLPSLYIFACLSGSQARLTEVIGLVGGLLTLTTILLIGFAPVAWVFSQSTSSVAMMGALHIVFWLVATAFGWKFLRHGFAHLSAKSGGALNVWLVIFVLVCLQMTAALRPIIGTAPTVFPTEKKFFLSHWHESMSGRQSPETRSGY